MKLEEVRAALRGVSAFKNVLDEPVMIQLNLLLDKLRARRGEEALDAYTRLFYTLRSEGAMGLGDWLDRALRYLDGPYPAMLAHGTPDPALENAARRDIDTLVLLSKLDSEQFIQALKELLPAQEYTSVLANLPRWAAGAPFSFDSLTDFYRCHGAGLFAKYRAFLWEDGELIPVAQPDCPAPEELLGYELQRNQVIANTRALVEGHLVNNVLLFGDSGTGKSATVKSLISLPGFESLRLIEVQKEGLSDMPQLIRTLRGRPQKFILFIDDLAFDQDDRVYSALKTILEGGLEPRPANVAVYATSNRRHLVRQTFSDRAGDEVDAFETISEKTALAERFGLRIPYLSMDKQGYLALVDHLASREGINMPAELLHAEAMKWDLRHGGRSPRTARQFIASLCVK